MTCLPIRVTTIPINQEAPHVQIHSPHNGLDRSSNGAHTPRQRDQGQGRRARLGPGDVDDLRDRDRAVGCRRSIAGVGVRGRHRKGHRLTDDGSAVVEFVLGAVFVLAIVLAIIQLALVAHIRNTVTDAAAEGARHSAAADASLSDGEQRTRELIISALSPRYAEHIRVDSINDGTDTLVRVQVTTPLPVIGLLGPSGQLTMSAHALAERD